MIELVITEAANVHMKRSQPIISYAAQLSAPFCQEFFPGKHKSNQTDGAYSSYFRCYIILH